jgi:TonB family protein
MENDMDRTRILRIAALALAASLIAAATPVRAAPAGMVDRISAAVARAMDYPPEARDEEGVVVLGFVVGGSGGAEAIKLIEASGRPLLDAAALSAVARLHGLPVEAAGKRLTVVLQYRTGGPGRDREAERRLQTSVDRVKFGRSSALLTVGYAR